MLEAIMCSVGLWIPLSHPFRLWWLTFLAKYATSNLLAAIFSYSHTLLSILCVKKNEYWPDQWKTLCVTGGNEREQIGEAATHCSWAHFSHFPWLSNLLASFLLHVFLSDPFSVSFSLPSVNWLHFILSLLSAPFSSQLHAVLSFSSTVPQLFNAYMQTS